MAGGTLEQADCSGQALEVIQPQSHSADQTMRNLVIASAAEEQRRSHGKVDRNLVNHPPIFLPNSAAGARADQ